MDSQSSESSGVEQGPSSCKSTDLRDQYEVLRDIGQGGFGQIKLARHCLTGAQVAVKVLQKKGKKLQVLSELNMMKSLEHPNVIQLFQVIETHGNIYLVMEHADGGELLDQVPLGGMQEEEARRLFREVVYAVAYCHDKGMVHRDLKPKNIMLDANGHIKLIDFGFSTWVTPGQKLKDFWGTLSYIAPEIIQRQAYEGPPVDIWSLGVTLYFMLTGKLPFMGSTRKETVRQIVLGLYPDPPHVSLAARMLIYQMLTLDPRKRPTAKQILRHIWLMQGERHLPPNYHEALLKQPDPEILTIMFDMGYDLRKTWMSLAKRKFNAAMATYLLLQHQKSQGQGFMFQGKPVPPMVKPQPCPLDPSHSPVLPIRSPSEPALRTYPLPCEPPLPEEANHLGQKHFRRASQPPIHFHFPPARTPTPGLASQSDSGQLHTSRKLWKRVTRGIATCVRQLCCCIPHVSNVVAPM
ncbi:sperm motility kinase 2B-like [Callospermophilus lateralis]|uniref:sperm motility kinase 2B-like n=1 Tax=Callospermophilus lateralis TaxID=76772 RepID=UPI004038A1E3